MKTAPIWNVEALLNPKLAGQSNVTKASELVHCDNPPSTNSFTYLRTWAELCFFCQIPKDKDLSGCIYTIASVNLEDLNILCRCHLGSLLLYLLKFTASTLWTTYCV